MKLFLIKSSKDKSKVAQRVLSFKKKTKLTVMNMHSKLLNEVEPPTNFQKGGGLTGPQLLEGVCWEKGE